VRVRILPRHCELGPSHHGQRFRTPGKQHSRTSLDPWTYSGLGLETRDSGEYHYVRGQVQRCKKQATIRGLNKNYNHDLKGLFKGAPGPV